MRGATSRVAWMSQAGMGLERSGPGGMSALGVAGHAPAPENGPISRSNETSPSRLSNRLLQQVRRRNREWRWGWLADRCGPRIRAMLEEEAAHGHAFPFVPVLIGGGAAIWFALPRDPPAITIAAFFLLFAVATACVGIGREACHGSCFW